MIDNKTYLKGLYNMTLKQFNGDATWKDVCDWERSNGSVINEDTVRKGARTLYKFLRAGQKLVPPDEQKEEANAEFFESMNDADRNEVSYDANTGSFTQNKLITFIEGEPITPKTMLEKHNLNPEEWDCVNYKNNFWTAQKKGGDRMVMYQSKITVKPKNQTEITYVDIDKYFESKKWVTRPYVAPFKHNDSEDYLEISYADNHLGLLSWNGETGSDYDIRIAEKSMRDTFKDILQRCEGKNYKLINFVTLGDILHIDNMGNTTTKGTPQDSDGRITKIFSIAVDLMCDCVDMLLQLGNPVRYTYTSGNHDAFSGYALAKAIQKVYEKDSRITFDISPNPQKIYQYGKTLVGYTHGDMPKKNLGEWVLTNYRKEVGLSNFVEVHCGHLHSYSVQEISGVLVRHLPTICESSFWEHKQGYRAQRGVMCFIYNENQGLRDNWTEYI